jgi:replicative DNA helicase
MNITLSVDDRVVEQARRAAQAMGKSLNQAVRDYLEQLAGQAQREAVVEELKSLSMKGRGPAAGWRFDRDEVYSERLDRRRGA